MGNPVEVISDVVGGVGGAVNNIVQQVPFIGPVLGPAAGIALGQNPISAFGSSLTGQLMNNSGGGGGGGGTTPTYAQPSFNYGNQTYAYRDTPLNTSKYFISGDRGVYNLLPALGQINTGTDKMGGQLRMNYDPNQPKFNKDIVAANAYTPYEAYQDIQAQMANDPKALAAFNKFYQPTSLLMSPNNQNSPMAEFLQNTPNPLGQYVDYGINDRMSGVEPKLGLTYNQIADYAAQNKNPFFIPYETTQNATTLGFTPSADKLAAIDTSQYLSGYNTAQTAQQQFDMQQQAIKAANDRRRLAEQQAAKKPILDTTRPIIDPARPVSQNPQSQVFPAQIQSLLSNFGVTGNNKGNSLLGNQTTSKSNTSKK